MKQISKKLSISLLIIISMVMVAATSCNSKSDDKSVQELTLTIGPKIVTNQTGVPSMSALNEATNVTFYIPVGGILYFNYEAGYTYRIVVYRYIETENGLPTGKDYYQLKREISKTKYTGDPDSEIKPAE